MGILAARPVVAIAPGRHIGVHGRAHRVAARPTPERAFDP